MKGVYGAIILFGCLLVSCQPSPPEPLPKLGNYDVVYHKKNGKEIRDTIYSTIPTFNFLNEDSVSVTNNDFKNKVWIVEFFFASCPTICPIMNQQLKKLVNETNKYKKHIQFLSFSIDPKNDVPSKLKEFKQRNGIKAKNWTFLTGDEATTHTLGIKHFLTFAGRDSLAEGGYAHSGSFTLVDKAGYVRGVYAVTNFDLTVNRDEYQRLLNDVTKLLKYEYHVVE
jgi:protein SCO1/2